MVSHTYISLHHLPRTLPGHDVISNTGLSVLYIVGRNGTTMFVFPIPYNNLSITIYHACKNQKVAIDPRIVLQPQASSVFGRVMVRTPCISSTFQYSVLPEADLCNESPKNYNNIDSHPEFADQDNANSLLKDYHLQKASPCIDLGNDYSKTDDFDRIGTRPVDGPNNTGTGDYDVIAECVMGVDEMGHWTVISKPSCGLTSARNNL